MEDMNCPNCKKEDQVRKEASVYICDGCHLGFVGFEKGQEICEALGHDLGGCTGGTCKRCGHFEQCG